MNRLIGSLIRFEALPDGGAGGGGGEDPFGPSPHLPAPEPVAEHQPQPELQPQYEQPEDEQGEPLLEADPSAWSPERAEALDEALGFIGELRDAMSQAERDQLAEQQRNQYAVSGELPEFDPVDPDNVTMYVAQGLSPWFQQVAEGQRAIMETLESIRPFAEHAAEDRGRTISNEVFDRLERSAAEGGMGIGPINRDLALTFSSLAQANGYEGEAALIQGALEAKRVADQIRAEGQEEVLDAQQRVRDLRREPGVGGGEGGPGEATVTPIQSRQAGRRPYRDSAAQSLARIRARRQEAQQ